MKQETINLTYDLITEIKDLKEYRRLLVLKKIISSDDIIQELMIEFNKQQTRYQETIKYGKHHPDLKKVQKEFSRSKDLLYNNEVVKEYKRLENEIQSKLNAISKELALSVSEKIRFPNELGLINKH